MSELANDVIERLIDLPSDVRQERLHVAANTLYRAAVDKRPFETSELYAKLAKLRVTEPEHLENCAAEAARWLGDDWVQDNLGFAAVSRASSRLFSFCKDVGAQWNKFRETEHSQNILLATIAPEVHLIGPTILTQRLRRKDHSVAHCSNASVEEIGARIEKGSFDCLMISSASQIGLENVSRAIHILRRSLKKQMPIVLGGPALEFFEDKAASAGADFVTNNENAALEYLTKTAVQDYDLLSGAAE